MNQQTERLIKYARNDPYFTKPGEYGKLMKFIRENNYPRVATPNDWLLIKIQFVLYAAGLKFATANELFPSSTAGYRAE